MKLVVGFGQSTMLLFDLGAGHEEEGWVADSEDRNKGCNGEVLADGTCWKRLTDLVLLDSICGYEKWR